MASDFEKFKKKLIVVEGNRLQRWWADRKLKRVSKTTSVEQGEKVGEFLMAAANVFHRHHPSGCLGLAANQFGFKERVCVIRRPNRNNFRVFVNPVITTGSRVQPKSEWCLSRPGVEFKVNRFKSVTVRADNYNELVTLTGIEGQAIQHEIDHLDGKEI